MTHRAAFRAALAALVVVSACALAAPAGTAHAADTKKDDKKAKLKKNTAWVAPDWDARAIRRIAIAPIQSVEQNPEAEKLVRRTLENALADRPYKFLGAGSILEAVKRSGSEDAWKAASAAFANGDPIDTTTCRKLHDALQTDALLWTNIVNWQRYLVDEQTRGASFTQVGVDVMMVSLHDGAVVWRGAFQEKGDGPYNEPGTVDPGNERDPGSNSVGRKGSLEPPLFEEVAEKLMTRVAASLPKPAPAAAPAGGQ